MKICSSKKIMEIGLDEVLSHLIKSVLSKNP